MKLRIENLCVISCGPFFNHWSETAVTVHPESIYSASLFPHFAIPRWSKLIFALKILHTTFQVTWDHSKFIKNKNKKPFRNHMLLSNHSLCREAQNWSQVHPVSTDHPCDVSAVYLEPTCGKFCLLDMIWKGTHMCIYKVPQLTVHVRAQTKLEVKAIVCRPLRQHGVMTHIWGRLQEHFCCFEGPSEHSGLHHP